MTEAHKKNKQLDHKEREVAKTKSKIIEKRPENGAIDEAKKKKSLIVNSLHYAPWCISVHVTQVLNYVSSAKVRSYQLITGDTFVVYWYS